MSTLSTWRSHFTEMVKPTVGSEASQSRTPRVVGGLSATRYGGVCGKAAAAEYHPPRRFNSSLVEATSTAVASRFISSRQLQHPTARTITQPGRQVATRTTNAGCRCGCKEGGRGQSARNTGCAASPTPLPIPQDTELTLLALGFKSDDRNMAQALRDEVEKLYKTEKQQASTNYFKQLARLYFNRDPNDDLRKDAVYNLYTMHRSYFSLNHDTFLTAVKLIDRFMVRIKVQPKYLACLATACYYVAVQEVENTENIPSLETLVAVSRCGGQASDLSRMIEIVRAKVCGRTAEDSQSVTLADYIRVFRAYFAPEVVATATESLALTVLSTTFYKYSWLHLSLAALVAAVQTFAVSRRNVGGSDSAAAAATATAAAGDNIAGDDGEGGCMCVALTGHRCKCRGGSAEAPANGEQAAMPTPSREATSRFLAHLGVDTARMAAELDECAGHLDAMVTEYRSRPRCRPRDLTWNVSRKTASQSQLLLRRRSLLETICEEDQREEPTIESSCGKAAVANGCNVAEIDEYLISMLFI